MIIIWCHGCLCITNLASVLNKSQPQLETSLTLPDLKGCLFETLRVPIMRWNKYRSRSGNQHYSFMCVCSLLFHFHFDALFLFFPFFSPPARFFGRIEFPQLFIFVHHYLGIQPRWKRGHFLFWFHKGFCAMVRLVFPEKKKKSSGSADTESKAYRSNLNVAAGMNNGVPVLCVYIIYLMFTSRKQYLVPALLTRSAECESLYGT